MTTGEEGKEGRPRWRDRIAVSQAGEGFAYVPGNMLVRGGDAEKRAEGLTGRPVEERPDLRQDKTAPQWRRITGVDDPLAVIGVLRSERLDAQPEHVFFAHDCSPCERGPHPSEQMSTIGADPFRANPFRANPFRANPFRANPFRANEAPLSSAEPALDRAFPARPELQGPGRAPRILVLDTGLAGGGQRPHRLDGAPRIDGAVDLPDDAITPVIGPPPFPPDGYLDPVAGHGTFIAGLIEQLACGCTIDAQRVIAPLGDGQELDIVAALEAATALPDGERPDIISMSFGGQVFEHAFALQTAVAAARRAGIVLVASAGNDGICIPQYPAAFDEVIGVAAVGPAGPPPWTNYGEWVDACAPGVELVSAFFAAFDGAFPMMNTVDIDRFEQWACWSGTSFSGPVVVAALAREMVVGDCDAPEAAQRVVRATHLLRLPCLGTVVNL
ncbi:MAG: S8 family peptidase [Solirubrobacteraceae bacterium]